MDSLERVLWWLFGSSLGAVTRARVLRAIHEEPRNAQQLATALGLDYTTIRHHLGVLQKNQLVVTAGQRYGQVYFLSNLMEARWESFEKIARRTAEKAGGVRDAA